MHQVLVMGGLGESKLLKKEWHQLYPKERSVEVELVFLSDVNVYSYSLATFPPLCRCHVLLAGPGAP